MSEFLLIEAMLYAPVCGLRRGSKTIHAVTMEAVAAKFKNKHANSVEAACGELVSIVGGDDWIGLWPPRAKGGMRCSKCYELTGRPRLRKPRSPVQTGATP